MTTVRIATRASDLARTQARQVAERLEVELGVATELVLVKTTGDRLQGISLAEVGGKGLFVKEIEEALLDGRADLAVHSAKDLPAEIPPGLDLVAFPRRADPRDALVARERGAALERLPRGARVGTGSLRRGAQLRALRPDLEIVPLRGNVPTRLRKVEGGELDAVVLACAGLDRLGLDERIDERIPPSLLLPAVGQGALAIEGRAGDPISRDAAALADEHTASSVAAERAFLVGLRGDCTVPLAALAEYTERGTLHLRALLASRDGSRIARQETEVPPEQAAAAGAATAEALLRAGGDSILDALRADRSIFS